MPTLKKGVKIKKGVKLAKNKKEKKPIPFRYPKYV
jgi:hypothetical protein